MITYDVFYFIENNYQMYRYFAEFKLYSRKKTNYFFQESIVKYVIRRQHKITLSYFSFAVKLDSPVIVSSLY